MILSVFEKTCFLAWRLFFFTCTHFDPPTFGPHAWSSKQKKYISAIDNMILLKNVHIFGPKFKMIFLGWGRKSWVSHAGRLKCYSNIRTFYAKLLQIWSYKFYHATENKILSISPGGATFQTTSPLRTEADFFSKILGLTRVWSVSGPHFLWWKNMRTRPGSNPDQTQNFRKKFEYLYPHFTH